MSNDSEIDLESVKEPMRRSYFAIGHSLLDIVRFKLAGKWW